MASVDFRRALTSTRELEITITGRQSGQQISLPVWFVHEGETLYLLPVKGRIASGTRISCGNRPW